VKLVGRGSKPPILVAASTKARSLSRIAGSNPVGGTGVCVVCCK
jgi:hypothetical protein